MTIQDQKDLIDQGYYKELNDLDERIGVLEMEKRMLRRARDRALHDLQQECLTLHGRHQDDDGFMFGSCKRCGAHLG
jgi:hypothetical protein